MDNSLIAGICLILFAIPAYFFLCRSIGVKRGLLVIFMLQIFALGIETFALKTGFPYGQFSYSDSLGYKLFGVTPWSVGLSWSMILIGAAGITHVLIKRKIFIIPALVLILLVTDLVLDPGAVALVYWKYAPSHGPHFYSVPWTNFLGWVISGTVGSTLFNFFVHKKISGKATISLLCIVLFWTGIDIYKSLYIPALIGFILIALCAFTVWVSVSSKE